jgi:hypothetical protein
MEAVCSPDTLVSTHKSTRRYNSEDQHRHLHRRENLKSHTRDSILPSYCRKTKSWSDESITAKEDPRSEVAVVDDSGICMYAQRTAKRGVPQNVAYKFFITFKDLVL